MPAGPDIPTLVAALREVAADPALPRRRARVAQDMADRMLRPARVTLLGLPAGDQAAVANALLETRLLSSDWPTTRIEAGPGLAYEATLADRRCVAGDGLPDPASFAAPPALIRLTAPLDCLSEFSLLVVRAGAAARDQQAALRWASRQTDVSVWCGADLATEELALWRAAPDLLRNHGFLVSDGGAPPGAGLFNDWFCRRSPGWARDLRTTLSDLIAEARSEAAAAAALFLQETGVRLDRLTRPAAEPAAADDDPVAPVAQPDGAKGARSDPEVWRLLSHMLQTLRRTAAELLAAFDRQQSDADPETDILDTVERLLGNLQDFLSSDDRAGDALSDLAEAIGEAAMTIVLLKYEGGSDPAGLAATVLVQVRQEIEIELEHAA